MWSTYSTEFLIGWMVKYKMLGILQKAKKCYLVHFKLHKKFFFKNFRSFKIYWLVSYKIVSKFIVLYKIQRVCLSVTKICTIHERLNNIFSVFNCLFAGLLAFLLAFLLICYLLTWLPASSALYLKSICVSSFKFFFLIPCLTYIWYMRKKCLLTPLVDEFNFCFYKEAVD